MSPNRFIFILQRIYNLVCGCFFFIIRCFLFVFNKRRLTRAVKFLKQRGLKYFIKVVFNKLTGKPASYGIPRSILTQEYGYGILEKQQDETTLLDTGAIIDGFKLKPLISIILPDTTTLSRTEKKAYTKTLKSINNQIYINFELCVDAGKARGEFIMHMQPGDELTPDALFRMVCEINEHPEACLLYSDEYKIFTGRVKETVFYCKPDLPLKLIQSGAVTGQLTLNKPNPATGAVPRHVERILYLSQCQSNPPIRTAAVSDNIISTLPNLDETLWFIKDGFFVAGNTWGDVLTPDKLHELSAGGKPAGSNDDNTAQFTESMISLFQAEYPRPAYIYTPPSAARHRPGGRNILFLMHCLDMFGAPIVLTDMVRFVLDNGDCPVILSSDDGPLRQVYTDMGIAVIINKILDRDPLALQNFAAKFDLVIINTLICGNFLKILDNGKLPILWWIHEPSSFLPYYRHLLPDEVSDKVKVYAVSKYCKNSLTDAHLSYNYGILSYGIPDYAAISTGSVSKNSGKSGKLKRITQGKMTFISIGGYSPVKGTDILLKAIRSIDKCLLTDVQFILIGRCQNPKNRLDKQVMKACADNEHITHCDIMPRDELIELYRMAGCIIVPSRQETVSAVVIEAAIFSKPSICSDETGVAEHMTDKINGLIFPNEDYKALAQQIMFAIKNREKMAAIGQTARRDIYNKHFTMDIYKQNVLDAIDKTLPNHRREPF